MAYFYKTDKLYYHVAPLYVSADSYHVPGYASALEARLRGTGSFSSVAVQAVPRGVFSGGGSLSVQVVGAHDFGDAADVAGLITGAAHYVGFGFDNSRIERRHTRFDNGPASSTSSGGGSSLWQNLQNLVQLGLQAPSPSQTYTPPVYNSPSPSPSPSYNAPATSYNAGNVLRVVGAYPDKSPTDLLKSYGPYLAIGIAAFFLLTSMSGGRR